MSIALAGGILAATADASESPAKAVTLAVATTLFGAWTLARAVARRIA